MGTPVCDYCSRPSAATTGATIYPHRPELSRLQFFACEPCGAWVGCHDGTSVPLGRLADASLRKARSEAHRAFDPIWKKQMEETRCSKRRARDQAYTWLAREMNLPVQECHIGAFDEGHCRAAITLCRARTASSSKPFSEMPPCR